MSSLREASQLLANLEAEADTLLEFKEMDEDRITRFIMSARNIAKDARNGIISYAIEHIDD